MSADEIFCLADHFVRLGVKKIRITGGEPLLHPDANRIIRSLAQLPAEIAITTNGSLLDRFIPTFLAAGIRSVNVSLDSLNRETFFRLAGRDEFEPVYRNIQLLLKNNFHVKVNVVVMNGYNDSEIRDFIAWTRHEPVHVRFIEFMPFPGNQWNAGRLITYREILEVVESGFEDIEKLNDGPHDTAKNFRVKGHAGTFAVISTMSEPFCDGCNRLRLTADGKMRNCLFAKTETDLLTPLRQGIDIAPLILECLLGKHRMLGGHQESDWAVMHSGSKERSMLAIGG